MVGQPVQRSRHSFGNIVVVEVPASAECKHRRNALKKLGALFVWHVQGRDRHDFRLRLAERDHDQYAGCLGSNGRPLSLQPRISPPSSSTILAHCWHSAISPRREYGSSSSSWPRRRALPFAASGNAHKVDRTAWFCLRSSAPPPRKLIIRPAIHVAAIDYLRRKLPAQLLNHAGFRVVATLTARHEPVEWRVHLAAGFDRDQVISDSGRLNAADFKARLAQRIRLQLELSQTLPPLSRVWPHCHVFTR
jgi:hypothetical protein